MVRKKRTGAGSRRKSKTPRGISRIDIDKQGTHGFMVRLCRQGEKTNVFFSDSKFGGKRKALVAAEKELKRLVRKLPPPDSSKNKMNVRNVSGRVGVYETNSGPSDAARDYLAYVASWTTGNRQRRKINFAFAKYGKSTAWKLACFARDHEVSDRKEVIRLFEKETGKKVVLKSSAGKKKAKKKPASKKAGKKKPVKKKATKKVKKKKSKPASRKKVKKKKKLASKKVAKKKVKKKRKSVKKTKRRK